MKLFLATALLLGHPQVEVTEVLKPAINISAPIALVDQEIDIQFTALKPLEKVWVQAEALDQKNEKWISSALFQADAQGKIDLSRQAPLEGSYRGVDPMGLFFSMKSNQICSFRAKSEAFQINLKLLREGQEIASTTLTRLSKAPEVKRIAVTEDGLVGALFLPPSSKPLPIIVTLSGSNGGLSEHRAQLLASHGFAVLALAYFGVEGLPTTLENIPIEYFEKGFNWIKKQPNLDSKRMAIYGVSRGGELSLILGTLFPDSFQAIAAVVPSSRINGGIGFKNAPAWTWQGKPFGNSIRIPIPSIDGKLGLDSATPILTVHSFLNEIEKSPEAHEKAAINVEKIKCPLIVVSAGDDHVWPSTLFATQIKKRLQQKNSKISFTHLDYPKAGHQINIPYMPASGVSYFHPVGKFWLSSGGSAQEDDHASRDSWKRIVAFFEKELKK